MCGGVRPCSAVGIGAARRFQHVGDERDIVACGVSRQIIVGENLCEYEGIAKLLKHESCLGL